MHRSRMRLAVLVLTTVTAVAGCAALPQATDPPAPPMPTVEQLLGAWQPQPYAVSASRAGELDAVCRADRDLAIGPAFELAFVDARGGGHADVFYVDARGAGECRLLLGDGGSAMVVGGGTHPDFVAPGRLGLSPTSKYTDSGGPDNEPVTSVMGAVGSGIERVRVVRPGGEIVEAAVRRGIFSAWWPAQDQTVTVHAYDGSGALVAEVSM